MKSSMQRSFWRDAAMVGLISLILIPLEAGLEYRTHARGFNTLIFGKAQSAANESGSSAFGPVPDFPFRSRIVAPDAPDGVTRLWVASASYGEDVAVLPSLIFPTLVGSDLTSDGHVVQVLNSSSAGDGILDNISQMELGLPTWHPDFALLYTMSNDINQLSGLFMDPGGVSPQSDQEILAKIEQSQELAWQAIFSRGLEDTKVFQGIKSKVTPHLLAARILADEIPDPVVLRFRNRLQAFVDVCRKNDVEPVLCTFAVNPLAFAGGSQGRSILMSRLRYNMYLSLDGWQEAVAGLNSVIRDFGDEAGVPVVEVATVVNDAKYFRDFVHFTELGHQTVAKCIATEVDHLLKDGGK